MKILIFTLLITFAFGAVIITQAQDEHNRLKVLFGSQKTFTKDKIKVKFLSLVEDSRCPEGVNCIWAGNAKIVVEISDKRQKEKFEINTNLGPKGATFGGYAINLTDLSPAPKQGKTTDKKSYIATFEISRLTR